MVIKRIHINDKIEYAGYYKGEVIDLNFMYPGQEVKFVSFNETKEQDNDN